MVTIEPLPVPLLEDEHSVLRVANSRVAVDLLIYAYQRGATAEDIAADFPTLKLADIHAVLNFYLSHRAEMDAYLKKQEVHSNELQRKVETLQPIEELRRRLLEREK